MGEVFVGWRRKIGCVTLLMALVFMMGWIRSQSKTDEFPIVQFTHHLAKIGSCKNSLRLEIYRSNTLIIAERQSVSIASEVPGHWPAPFYYSLDDPKNSEPLTLSNRPAVYRYPIEWLFKSQGIGVGKCTSANLPGKARLDVCVAPYWSITIPLTLISAYLLLTKSRQSTPKKIPEPIPAEGA